VRRATLLLLLLCGVTFLAGLGRPAIGDSDEAFYAEAAREMVERGDWLTPHYNYDVRFQKPILFYWLVATTYTVAGIGETQARFWAALSGVGLSFVVLLAGRRWFDERAALVGAAIVATAFGYFSIGRLALPDLPLAFFITVTIVAALVGTVDGDHVHARRWLYLAGAAAGCAFLTKGPVGLLVPAIVLVPIWWLERRQLRIAPGHALGAVVVAMAIGVPWYLAMAATHGHAYLESFFVGDNLERFATSRFNDPRPLWFYIPIVLGGMLPWTPLVAVVTPLLRARATRQQWLSRRTWRMILWAALPLAFFTISIGKQPRYVLPILPPLALLLADAIVQRWAACGERRDPLVQIPGIFIAVLLGVMAVLLYRARPLIVMVPPAFINAAVVAIAVASGIVLGASLAPRSRALPACVAVSAALTLAGLQYALSPAGHDPVQNMAALVLQHRTGSEPIVTFRVFVRNLIFYTHVQQDDLESEAEVVEFLRSNERVLCVIRADELERIQRIESVATRTLGEVLYFNASAVKLRTLFSPDPDRDLDRVLLVTNR
jgi:4-amino-4-deoxy-L-arabinose transferase-like glycosyltransferase